MERLDLLICPQRRDQQTAGGLVLGVGFLVLIEEVETVFVSFTRDLSNLALDEFWVVLDHLQLAHPYDADGVRQPFTDMPRKLPKLADDPYRSLSAEVRRAGGYAKETAPFSEFLWADFFRRRISATLPAASCLQANTIQISSVLCWLAS